MPAPKTAWISGSRHENKPWGFTQVWHSNGAIHGKVITLHAGNRTSLKYHRVKNEVFYVMSGSVRVTYGDSKTLKNGEKHPYQTKVLKSTDVMHVQSECPYRLEALEDAVIVEIGDRVDDYPVMLEDDYGRAKKE
jgi:mannose-6-phosphate isomerase-like protein (cupin superfamily)